jgi:hypothetical protein
LKPLLSYASDEDSKKAAECDREVVELEKKGKVLKDVLNLIRFGKELIPADLRVSKESTDLPPARKVISLHLATQQVHALVQKVRGKSKQIDICKDFLLQNEIRDKPGYMAHQLNNAVFKYAAKLKNKQDVGK